MKTILVLFLLVAGITAFGQDEFTKVKNGAAAPDFSFEIKPGQAKKLSDLKGKVVLLNFFATWCGPCRQELPHLEKEVFEKYNSNKDFELLIFGREQNWKTVDSFKVANHFSMNFYPDEGRKIFSVYAGQNIPRNFLIDKSGKVVYTSVGYSDEEFKKLKDTLAGLLK
jgi:thiol-disulfide isomerase/thioredoxin